MKSKIQMQATMKKKNCSKRRNIFSQPLLHMTVCSWNQNILQVCFWSDELMIDSSNYSFKSQLAEINFHRLIPLSCNSQLCIYHIVVKLNVHLVSLLCSYMLMQGHPAHPAKFCSSVVNPLLDIYESEMTRTCKDALTAICIPLCSESSTMEILVPMFVFKNQYNI